MHINDGALLPYGFYEKGTVTVARELLGKKMVVEEGGLLLAGTVVETEAYLGRDDPACHSASGKSRRNAVMFGPSGHAYIYLIYGIHLCFNITTGPPDKPKAVLIRALEPTDGIEIMRNNRGQENIFNLCSGPGKLVQAMGITMDHNGCSVVEGPIRFFNCPVQRAVEVTASARVGISKAADWPLRFYIKGNKFISKK